MTAGARRAIATGVAAVLACCVAGCSAASPVRLEPATEPAREMQAPPVDAAPTESGTPAAGAARAQLTEDELDYIDRLSEIGYWDVHDGTVWEYRVTTSAGLEVSATRTSRVIAVRDGGVDVSVSQQYTFPDGRFEPVSIVSEARTEVDGSYWEDMQLGFNQAWRQAPDPVFDDVFTIPSASQLQHATAPAEPIEIGPLGSGPYEEYERSTRTIRAAGAGELQVLGATRDVVCFAEVRAGEVEGPDGTTTPFERRADLCFVQGLGLVSSRTEAGDAWEEWTLVASTSERA